MNNRRNLPALIDPPGERATIPRPVMGRPIASANVGTRQAPKTPAPSNALQRQAWTANQARKRLPSPLPRRELLGAAQGVAPRPEIGRGMDLTPMNLE